MDGNGHGSADAQPRNDACLVRRSNESDISDESDIPRPPTIHPHRLDYRLDPSVCAQANQIRKTTQKPPTYDTTSICFGRFITMPAFGL